MTVHARRNLYRQRPGSTEGVVQGGSGEGEVPGERLGHVMAGGGGDQRPGKVVGEIGFVPVPRVVRDCHGGPSPYTIQQRGVDGRVGAPGIGVRGQYRTRR